MNRMNREWWLHASVVVVGAVLALLTANGSLKSSKKESDANVAPLVDGKVLQAVAYTWPDAEVELKVSTHDDERSAVVAYHKDIFVKKPVTSTDGGVLLDDAGVAKSTQSKERQTKRFPAGKTVGRALKKLLPFEVVRALGPVDDAKLDAMGLKTPERTLTVTVDGAIHRFDIGVAAYGNRHRYVRKQGNADVFLVDNNAVRGLEGGHTRLMDRRVLNFDWADVVALEVSGMGDDAPRRRFQLLDAEQSKTRRFVEPGAPDVTVDEAMAVARSIQRVSARTYVDAGDIQGAPVGRFVVEQKGKKLTGIVYGDKAPYHAKVGPWVVEVPEGQAKELVDDLQVLVKLP